MSLHSAYPLSLPPHPTNNFTTIVWRRHERHQNVCVGPTPEEKRDPPPKKDRRRNLEIDAATEEKVLQGTEVNAEYFHLQKYFERTDGRMGKVVFRGLLLCLNIWENIIEEGSR